MRHALLSLPFIVILAIGCSDDASNDGGGGAGGSGDTTGGNQNGPTTSTKSGPSSTKTGGGTTATGTAQCEGGPLAEPIAGCAPAVMPSSGDPHQDCVDRINQFRWECQCLPPLQRWTEAEGCTDDQAADDQAINQAHSHFPACGESAQNTCPNWGSEGEVVEGCLQMMWDEGPGEPFEEHGHYINMSSTGYTKVACGFSSTNDGVWANQNFSQ
jgi:hypothetical protein